MFNPLEALFGARRNGDAASHLEGLSQRSALVNMESEILVAGQVHARTAKHDGLLEVYTACDLSHLEELKGLSVTENFLVSMKSKGPFGAAKSLPASIQKKLEHVPAHLKPVVAELVADLCGIYAHKSHRDEMRVSMFSTRPQGRPESYPGEGLHYDNKDFRLYLSLGEGMQWVLPESIDPIAMKVITKGRNPGTMFLGDTPKYNQVQAGEIVFFHGTKLPHRTPFSDKVRQLIIIDTL